MAAKPPLVVAMASNPSEANRAADPMSQALGISRGVPGVCSAQEPLGPLGGGRVDWS